MAWRYGKIPLSAWVPFAATIIVALVGISGTFIVASRNLDHEKKMVAQEQRLVRVNAQLSDFYGPLFSLADTGNRLYVKFCHGEGRSYENGYFEFDKDGTELRTAEQEDPEKLCNWMRVMEQVFLPLNQEIEHLVIHHSSLVEDGEVPEVLIEVAAHVAEFRSVMKKWQNYDPCGGQWDHEKVKNAYRTQGKKAFTPVMRYPRELKDHAKQKFNLLKRRQSAIHQEFGIVAEDEKKKVPDEGKADQSQAQPSGS